MKARKAAHVVLSLFGLVFAASCLDATDPAVADSEIRIINASGQILNLFLDDRLAIDESQQGNVSLIRAASGTHKLTFRNQNGVETPITVAMPPAGFRTAYAYTNDADEVVAVLLDTIAPPTVGKASVRVINLSKLAGAVDIYNSQPAGSAGTLFVSPFSYLTESEYVEKAAGSWEVYTTAAGATTKLQTTGEFPIEGQGRRTVVLLDVAGVPALRVLPN